MRFNVRILVAVILFFICCTNGFAQRRAAGQLARVTERAGIVPRVDHHQHIVGPRAAIPWPALPPTADLPPGLSRVVSERNRIMGTQDVGDLYTDAARVLDVQEEGQPWA